MGLTYVARKSDALACKALYVLAAARNEQVVILEDDAKAPPGSVAVTSRPHLDWYARVVSVGGNHHRLFTVEKDGWLMKATAVVGVRLPSSGSETAFAKAVRRVSPFMENMMDQHIV